MNSGIEDLRETEGRRAYSAERNGYAIRPSVVDGLADDEALRLIHQVLQQGESHPSVITFAGMDQGNGCSRVCLLVAELLARDPGRSVCLVEANLRSPGISGLFGAAGRPGLTEALMEKSAVRSFCVPVNTRGNLWLLPCGTLFPDAGGLLTSEALRERIVELDATFDYVIIDTPALSQHADAFALGYLSDGLVLIVEDGATRRDETAAVVANLRASGVTILAAVLNKATSPVPDKIYKRL